MATIRRCNFALWDFGGFMTAVALEIQELTIYARAKIPLYLGAGGRYYTDQATLENPLFQIGDIKGDTGEKGEKGDTGATGATGAAGAQGVSGSNGDKGDRGATGDAGVVTPTPWKALPLINGWVNFGSAFGNAQYRKVNDIVEVRGVIKGGLTANYAACAMLPVGHRPLKTYIFTKHSSEKLCRVDIDFNGGILMGANATSGWVSLDSIQFSTL